MTQADDVTTLHIGREELVIRQRYEVLSITNDIILGLLFLVGSFLFLNESTTIDGTWLFVVGSFMMLIRPVIRLTRRVHLQRRSSAGPHETVTDF